MKAAVVLLFCMLAAGATVGARDNLSVTCNPTVGMAPATVQITVRVEPDEANRTLTVETDSGMFYTSSSVTLDGDKAPRFQPFTFKGLPPGEYQVYAWVNKGSSRESRAQAQYVVME